MGLGWDSVLKNIAIAVLTLSSLIIVGSAFAQSVSKPSAPDFTAKIVGDTIEVTIKNQPLTSYENGSYPSLYYMFTTQYILCFLQLMGVITRHLTLIPL